MRNYDQRVPFTSKDRGRYTDAAVDRVIRLAAQRAQLALEMGEAIRDALEKGATLRELAEKLGVSHETVRKMAATE
jgi:DNA-binding NarL/FixJ family response regulator